MVTPATITDTAPLSNDVLPLEVAEDAPLLDTAPSPVPETAAPSSPPPPLETRQPPSEVQYLRQKLAKLEAEQQSQAIEASLLQESRAAQQEATARGLSEEDAIWIADRHYRLAKRVSEETQRLQEQQQYLQAKQQAAILIGKDHGVEPDLLMTANSPDEMNAIAAREKRYIAQEARLKALEQRSIPAQSLNVSNGSRAGAITPTRDNIDKLWLEHEIQNPGAPNPYEAAYRRLLG